MSKVGAWVVELPERAMRWTGQLYQLHEVPPDYEPSLDGALAFYAPECRETFRNAFEACANDGTPFHLTLEMITATGRRVRVRTMGEADSPNGKPQRVLGIMQEFSGGSDPHLTAST
jgi:rsbT co-antagonist protein RsbR